MIVTTPGCPPAPIVTVPGPIPVTVRIKSSFKDGKLTLLVDGEAIETIPLVKSSRETELQIEVTLTNIREISDKLNNGEGTLGKLIADDSLFLDAKATLKKVDTALDGFSDQGPITAVGIGAQAIF